MILGHKAPQAISISFIFFLFFSFSSSLHLHILSLKFLLACLRSFPSNYSCQGSAPWHQSITWWWRHSWRRSGAEWLISDCVCGDEDSDAANITSARQAHLHQAAILPFCDDSLTSVTYWPNRVAEPALAQASNTHNVTPFQQEISQ